MDDEPFFKPDRKPPPRQAVPGTKLWELRKGEHVAQCELRDDEQAGAGVDVQILDVDRWPLFTQRCQDQRGAEFVAASYRRDFLNRGWHEPK